MKTAFVLFLIFVAFGSSRVIDRINELRPLCKTTPPLINVLKKVNLDNYPAQSAGQSFYGLTVAFFTHFHGDECDPKVAIADSTLLEIKIGGNKLLELINTVTAGSEKQVLNVYDKDNTQVSVMTVPVMKADLEERVAISIDLKNGVVSVGMMGGFLMDAPYTPYTTVTKDSINFGTLAFDDSIEITFNPNYHTGDIALEYSESASLYQYMFTPQAPKDITLYEMKEGSGNSVKSNGKSADDTIYFGANTGISTDKSAETNPSWAGNDGIAFTKSTQYLFKPATEAFYGTSGDYHQWERSFTTSLWINLEKNTEQTILRSLRDSQWVTDAFVIKTNKDGKVVVEVAGNVLATSNEAIPINQFTLLTVHFGGFQDFFAYANIYFGATLQTEKFNLVKLKASASRRVLASGDSKGMVFGGFIGKLRSFATMGAGAVELKASTTPGCMVDFGFESSTCLGIAETCPNGSTTLPCVDVEEDEDGYHLSGGAVSGIVIGSVAFGLAVGAAIVFVINRSRKGATKGVNRYQLPSSPTEA